MHLQNMVVSWEVRIDGSALSAEGLEYCFIFKMSDGGMLAFPKENPLEQPHVLVVLPMIFPEKIIDVIEPVFQQESVSAEILILAPEPEAEINSKNAIIAVSLFNIPDVDSASIRLVVDDKGLTGVPSIFDIDIRTV